MGSSKSGHRIDHLRKLPRGNKKVPKFVDIFIDAPLIHELSAKDLSVVQNSVFTNHCATHKS